jgi:hypothetical protein
MLKVRIADFSLTVVGPFGLAALVLIVLAAGAWAYVHGFSLF